MGDVLGFCLLSPPFLDTLLARQEEGTETLAESTTGATVMAPRLRTQLIAPQESAQWISDEPPGNPRPSSMSDSVAVLETHNCAMHSLPRANFIMGGVNNC